MAAIDQATHYESFVAILDGDLDPVLEEMGLKPPRAITHRRLIIWERYHIENYLLEPKALVAVHDELHGAKRFASESHAEESLKAHADSLRPTLEANCVEVAVWQACGLEIKLDPDELLASLARCAEEQAQRIGTTLQDPRWRELRVRGVSEWFANHWDREWRRICRGRDVLQAFHIEHVSPAVMPFDAYVEAVARKIGQLGVEDPKVRTVLDAICATA
jgi:hypothetical protein